jgi:hypothetical protein
MTPGQPCWGEVTAVGDHEDGEAVWACEGHEEMWDATLYTVQETGERVRPSFDGEPEPPK